MTRTFPKPSPFLLCACFLIEAGAAPAPPTDKDRLDALVQYAGTVLVHGRDSYGEEHTPIFSDYLEVSTLRAPEMIYIHRLGGPGPRSKQPFQPVIASNLAYQGNLMRFLVGLSNLTGEAKYKEAYKECLRYYFEHYAVPNGLLQMGHHRWVNLNTDRYDGNDWPAGGSGHEMKRDYPYYPIFWETDPVATRRMLTAHWSSHIQDWGFMNFTRHGSYVKELNEKTVWSQPVTEPVKGIVKGNLTFFDSGSDLIYAGAQLGILNKDDRPLFWAQRLYARYADSAHPDTGLPPWHHTSLREFGSQDEPVPEYALITAGSAGLMINGGVAMLRLGDDLGDKGGYYRKTMLSHLRAYAKYCYRPEVNEMRNYLFDGTDLAEREKKNAKPGDPPSNAWRPWNPAPATLLAYSICYRQSSDGEIWETLRAMCRGNDLGDIGERGGKLPVLNLATKETKTNLIFPLVELFRATGNNVYLDLGRRIANNAFTKHFRAKQALFTPSELHRTANLCSAEPLALLTLEAALRGKLAQVPTYAASNEGEQVPYLRPLKSRPYNPSASHLSYPYTVKALCDDLLPASSGDTSVPVMSWENVRKASDEAIVTFPDLLKGPVTISGMTDQPETRNSVSAMLIDSMHRYTFVGNLNGTGDLAVTVKRGEHVWAPGSTWTTTAWSPSETYDLVMNIARGAKLSFHGLVQEVQGAQTWCSGAGIIKNGRGICELTADYAPIYNADRRNNRSYRAATVVNAGVLLVNNTSGSGVSPKSTVEVNHGATLSGNGAIGVGGSSALVVVNSGGRIDPGDGIGTLTLRDGLKLNDGARMQFEVGEKADLLRITGGTFQGSNERSVVVTIKDLGGVKAGRSYNLIDFTGASFIGVDANDFRLDKSQNFQGTFHLVGTRLQFSVFAPRLTPETPPAMPPVPVPVPKPALPADRKRPKSHYTWANAKGGEWSNPANWRGERIPNVKEAEWVQYEFEKPRKVSGVQIYWFANGHDRKVPESWRVLYRHKGAWKPAEALGDYPVEPDQFNEVKFRPVETDSVKLKARLQSGISAGIQEWRVLP
jgi:pectate lyase